MPAPTYVGKVVSIRMQKTVNVAVNRYLKHKKYPVLVRRIKKFPTHDPEQSAGLGDLVKIQLGRPVSKTKRWHLVDVIKRNPL